MRRSPVPLIIVFLLGAAAAVLIAVAAYYYQQRRCYSLEVRHRAAMLCATERAISCSLFPSDLEQMQRDGVALEGCP